MNKRDESIILFMSSYPPRECGIATFTKDTYDSFVKRFPSIKCSVLAMNTEETKELEYPSEVIYKINQENQDEYERAAEFIDKNEDIKLVIIQHEYGIFGGDYGIYLDFLEFFLLLQQNLSNH